MLERVKYANPAQAGFKNFAISTLYTIAVIPVADYGVACKLMT
jgi:hypothetical protein